MAKLLNTDPFAEQSRQQVSPEPTGLVVTPKPIRLSVDIDPDLHYRLRLLALTRRVPAASLARDAIARMVEESTNS